MLSLSKQTRDQVYDYAEGVKLFGTRNSNSVIRLKKVKLPSNSDPPEQLVEEPDVSKRYIDQVIQASKDAHKASQ